MRPTITKLPVRAIKQCLIVLTISVCGHTPVSRYQCESMVYDVQFLGNMRLVADNYLHAHRQGEKGGVGTRKSCTSAYFYMSALVPTRSKMYPRLEQRPQSTLTVISKKADTPDTILPLFPIQNPLQSSED